MVRAALGIVYLLASATANGWNLLKLGLSTGSNHTEPSGPPPEAPPRDRGDAKDSSSWWHVAWSRAYNLYGGRLVAKQIKMLLQVAEMG